MHLTQYAGGKWTTYRLMAEETVDKCVKVCGLKAGKSRTKGLLLDGAHDWTPTMFIRLIQDFGLDHKVTLISRLLTAVITGVGAQGMGGSIVLTDVTEGDYLPHFSAVTHDIFTI